MARRRKEDNDRVSDKQSEDRLASFASIISRVSTMAHKKKKVSSNAGKRPKLSCLLPWKPSLFTRRCFSSSYFDGPGGAFFSREKKRPKCVHHYKGERSKPPACLGRRLTIQRMRRFLQTGLPSKEDSHPKEWKIFREKHVPMFFAS